MIETFEDYIKKLVPDNITFLGVREYISRKAKRIRPTLLFLTYASYKGYYEDIFSYGAIIELFHNFTLIHDDIEDGSKLRRGLPTLNEKYGIPLALNAGDALYTLVLKLVNKIEDSFLREWILDVFMEVVEGQAMDIYWREKNLFPTEDEYYQMIEKKTGALMGLSMGMGAYLADQDYEYYENYGRLLGVAFQIQDDLLNLQKGLKEYGKTWADDITEGKRTLMVVKSLEIIQDKELLKELISSKVEDDERKSKAIELMKPGIEYANKVLKDMFEELDEYKKEIPETEYGVMLKDLIDNMKNRKK
jgi:geranylgeranyl diphosphate synthase type I